MIKNVPPKWADRFLDWYCCADLLEEIQGDAYELFYRTIKVSDRKARWQFVWNVFRFFRLKNIRAVKLSQSNFSLAMLANILKVAFRNFLRQPGHSLLNVLGLAVSFL